MRNRSERAGRKNAERQQEECVVFIVSQQKNYMARRQSRRETTNMTIAARSEPVLPRAGTHCCLVAVLPAKQEPEPGLDHSRHEWIRPMNDRLASEEPRSEQSHVRRLGAHDWSHAVAQREQQADQDDADGKRSARAREQHRYDRRDRDGAEEVEHRCHPSAPEEKPVGDRKQCAFHNIGRQTGRRPRGSVANATPKPVAKKKMTGATLWRNIAAPRSDVAASASENRPSPAWLTIAKSPRNSAGHQAPTQHSRAASATPGRSTRPP